MDQNTEFLNYIYQNAGMGVETVGQILEMIDHDAFSRHLRTQLDEYRGICDEAKQKLHESGHQEKDINAMQKISAHMSISIKTLADKTPSHIAEMMMRGSVMGIIEAIKNLRRYADADKSIIALANRLLKTEENNFEQLKDFL